VRGHRTRLFIEHRGVIDLEVVVDVRFLETIADCVQVAVEGITRLDPCMYVAPRICFESTQGLADGVGTS
jgi:hypothetical protein